MKQKYSSIKSKLLRIVLLTSGAVLFITCSMFLAYEFFTFRESTRDQLATLGKIIAANSTAALAFESPGDANEILQALKAETHIIAASLYDGQGNLFAKYPTGLSDSKIPKHPRTDGYKYVKATIEGFEPVIQQEKRVGTLYLQSDMKAVYKRIKLYGIVLSVVIVLVVCVALLLSAQLQKTVLSPILALAKTAGKVSNKKDYTVRAQQFANDEIGELTFAFNQMLTEIERQNAEITSLNRNLEIKVDERTMELEVANTELTLKNEFVEKIIDSSVDMLLVFDKELRYVVFNKHAQQVTGLQPEEVIGKHLLEVFPDVERSQMYTDLNQALQGRRIHNPYYKSDVTNKIFENYYIPLLDKDGHVYSILLLGHDITETIAATEKLSTLNSELAKSNRDLEQFAYVASHDLQEPLRKIQTYASFLEREMDNKEAAINYIGKIILSVIRMRDLIRSILNYSQASNVKGSFERVNLNEIIDGIKVDYELSIGEKGAEITAAVFPVITGDKLQLSQLFLNLISNSLKFCRRKPEIIIDCRIVRADYLQQKEFTKVNDRYLMVLYSDNGIGFDPKFSDRIFTIFNRFHSRTEYPGTGIGLALCKKIAENHNGHIAVNSKQGEGSTFEVYLPLDLQSS